MMATTRYPFWGKTLKPQQKIILSGFDVRYFSYKSLFFIKT